MRVLPCLFLAALLGSCSPGSSPPVSGSTDALGPSQHTSVLESPTGSLHLAFNLIGDVVPGAPVLVSFDGAIADTIALPHGETRYGLADGTHRITLGMSQSNCGIQGFPADTAFKYEDRVTISGSTQVYYIVNISCTVSGVKFRAKVTPQGSVTPDQHLLLTVQADSFSAQQLSLAADGVNREIGTLHVGLYHFRVGGIPAGCSVFGIGGVNDDTVRIGPSTTLIAFYYYLTCPG